MNDFITPAVKTKDLDSKILERIERDPVLMEHLMHRLLDEVKPLMYSLGIENFSVVEAFDIPHIINISDQIIAIENSRFMAINGSGYLIPLSTIDLTGSKARGFLETSSKPLLVSKWIEGVYSGDPNELPRVLAKIRQKTMEIVTSYLRINRYANSINRGVDMFIEKTTLRLNEQVASYRQPYKTLTDKLKSKMSSETKWIDEVMKDFTLHFPEFLDFLNLVCAARFAPDRRKAFLWLNAEAGWGKGFLMEAFKRIELVTGLSEKDVEAAFEGKPVGIDPDLTAKSFILLFDEAKYVKSEMKQLNNEITMAPKFEKRTTVPVYLKLFTTAEGMDSLSGEEGVEKQFAERFCYMSGKGRIEDRPLFKELHSHLYLKALTFSIAEYIDQYVDEMREIGEEEAYIIAETQLNAIHDEYRIDNALGGLQSSIEEHAAELTKLIRSVGKLHYEREVSHSMNAHLPVELDCLPDHLLKHLRRDVSLAYTGAERTQVYLLKKPMSFIKLWIKFVVNSSEVVKVGFKAKAICESASDYPIDKPRRVFERVDDTVTKIFKGVIVNKVEIIKDDVMPDCDVDVSFL